MAANRGTQRLRIVLLGYLIRGPLGGLSWHHLQYALGLVALGHDVMYVEDSDDYPSCFDPQLNAMTTDPSYGLNYATDVFSQVGLHDRWAYFDAHKGCWHGPLAPRLAAPDFAADLLINVSEINPIRDWMLRIPRRALIDTDPAFIQIRHVSSDESMRQALFHTSFFTFGEGFERGSETFPDDGLDWRPTRQPIYLPAWQDDAGPSGGRFTTIMQWNSFAAAEYQGRRFGMKSESFQPFLSLPSLTSCDLELSTNIDAQTAKLLRRHKWHLSSALETSRNPWIYQRYIQRSRAEFSVAKHGYVVSRSGWFSERSACYLASGRPVVTQETGFSDWLHADGGVFAFSDIDEALDCIERVNADYQSQCRHAREVAAEYFDSRVVLSRLIEEATTTPRTQTI